MIPKEKALNVFQQPIEDNWSENAIKLINKAIDTAIKEERKRILNKLFPTEERRFYGIKLTYEELKKEMKYKR